MDDYKEFIIYNLQLIHLPLPNQENQWMIAIHKPYIAVNIDSGTYVTLNIIKGIMYSVNQ